MATPFASESPLGALERYLLDSSQPEDVGILRNLLFSEDGELTDPHNSCSRPLGLQVFTPAVCAKHGLTSSQNHKALCAVFGDRADEEHPTMLLAFLTAYDALAGTSHLKDESNPLIDDQYFWQQDSDIDD